LTAIYQEILDLH